MLCCCPGFSCRSPKVLPVDYDESLPRNIALAVSFPGSEKVMQSENIQKIFLALASSQDDGRNAIFSFLQKGCVCVPIKELSRKIDLQTLVYPAIQHANTLFATFFSTQRKLFPVTYENLSQWLLSILAARTRIRKHDFRGTENKFENTCVGIGLFGIEATFPKDVALRSSFKFPDRLFKWEATKTFINVDACEPFKEEGNIFLLPTISSYYSHDIDMLGIQFFSESSSIGRRAKSEDFSLIKNVLSSSDELISIFGIFDGHGGEAVSRFLSQKMAFIFQEQFSLLRKPLEKATNAEIENILTVAPVKANQLFKKTYRGLYASEGSTLLCALIIRNQEGRSLWVVNTGDSKILAIKENFFYELTEDARVYIGQYTKSAEFRGGKIIGGRLDSLSVLRTVGDDFVKGVTARAKVTCFPLSDDTPTTFIMGCDGLFEKTSPKEIVETYFKAEKASCLNAATNLVVRAYNDKSSDNISAIVFRVE